MLSLDGQLSEAVHLAHEVISARTVKCHVGIELKITSAARQLHQALRPRCVIPKCHGIAPRLYGHSPGISDGSADTENQ